jgi:hypothetical protein
LARQPHTSPRQLAQRQAEPRIIAQGIQIIGILVAAGDREDPRAQDILKPMNHPRRIAMISNASGKSPADPHHPLGLSQHQHPAIRGQSATIESGCDLLAANRWKSK